MATARTALEQRLLASLRRIAAYDSPSRLRKYGEKDWGIGFEETIEMAYENIQQEAKSAISGIRIVKQKS